MPRRKIARDFEYFSTLDMEQQVLFDELAARVVEQSAEAILTLAREMRLHSLTDEEGNLTDQAEIRNAVRDIEWVLESNTGFMYMADAGDTRLVIECGYRNKSRYVPAIDPNPIKTLVIEMEVHGADITVYPDNDVFYDCYPLTAALDFRTGELRVEQ